MTLRDGHRPAASLGFLLDHRPPGLHPVLASRADPPLALARLRARGQLAELRDVQDGGHVVGCGLHRHEPDIRAGADWQAARGWSALAGAGGGDDGVEGACCRVVHVPADPDVGG
jgi:hypothetical protein